MLEELRWKTSVSTTCLHAAACRCAGMPAADEQLAAVIDPAADALIREISDAVWPAAAVLDELTSLASEIGNNRDLVARAITRLRLPMKDATAPVRIAGAVADLEATLNRARPELADELTSRVRPLREQWEARGPGMLTEIARLTDAAVVPTAAEIVLVAPYAGGHGIAHPMQNRVTLEAVLVNPLAQLPETVRLAWLVCQLNAEMPIVTDVIPPARSLAAVKLAMVTPVLAAAEAVELTACNEGSIAAALQAWLPEIDATSAAPQLWNWWNAWLDRSATWPIAVAALEQMVR